RSDFEIGKLEQTIQAGKDELAALDYVEQSLAQQFVATKEKLEAEVEKARQKLRRDQLRQDAEVARYEAKLKNADTKDNMNAKLVENRATSLIDKLGTEERLIDFKAELKNAQIPLDAETIEVLRRDLQKAKDDYAVELAKLKRERGNKQQAIESAKLDL